MKGNQEIMVKRVNNKQNSNINNTYSDNIKMVERPVKIYKWCWKCGCELPEGSINPFCCWEDQQEFYAENAKEIDSVWLEIRGID